MDINVNESEQQQQMEIDEDESEEQQQMGSCKNDSKINYNADYQLFITDMNHINAHIFARDSVKLMPRSKKLNHDQERTVFKQYDILLARAGNAVFMENPDATSPQLNQLIPDRFMELVRDLSSSESFARPSFIESDEYWRLHILKRTGLKNAIQLQAHYKKIRREFATMYNVVWYMEEGNRTERTAIVTQRFQSWTDIQTEFWDVWLKLGPGGEYLENLAGYKSPPYRHARLNQYLTDRINQMKATPTQTVLVVPAGGPTDGAIDGFTDGHNDATNEQGTNP